MNRFTYLAAICVGLAAVGCTGGGQLPPAEPAAEVKAKVEAPVVINSPAGVPMKPNADQKRWTPLITAKGFVSRKDPFALLPIEEKYEAKQTAERIFGELGGFHDLYVPPPVVFPEEQPFEPQPRRRLAGILTGDSVTALLELVDEGGVTILIRPGQVVQTGNDYWTVISIDSDKAVLRRDFRKKPNEVTVRLESR